MFLFLDDERIPSDVTWITIPFANWVIVRNYQEFVDHINENGIPQFVTFDHDLADQHYQVTIEEVNSFEYDDGDLKKTFDYGPEKTGFDCAKWLVDYCHTNNIDFPPFMVHSMNPIGKKRISDYILDALDKGYIKW